jgi:hypothetical protein
MTDVFAIRKGVPIPFLSKPKSGLTETLRRMEYGDSIVVPNSKRGSVYSCAAQAGIKIQTQSNLDGSTTTVWRVDEGASGPASGGVLKMRCFAEPLAQQRNNAVQTKSGVSDANSR